MQQPEKRLTKEIQLICGSELGWMCFDVNVGKFQMKNGRWFDVGLPAGYPDLMILTNDGRVLFIEAKVNSNKPSAKQIHFINLLREKGFFADVIWSVEQFRELIKNGFTAYNYV